MPSPNPRPKPWLPRSCSPSRCPTRSASLARSGPASWATTARWRASTPARRASTRSAASLSSAAETAGAGRLRVGGLQRWTSIDFPGRLAAVVFCQGCPWRCSYCQNPELLDASAAPQFAWDEVLDFLRGRQGLLDGVVFSGGEPLLQAAL